MSFLHIGILRFIDGFDSRYPLFSRNRAIARFFFCGMQKEGLSR